MGAAVRRAVVSRAVVKVVVKVVVREWEHVWWRDGVG
jgi:hypothetical protein